MKMHICRQHFNREFIDGALMEYIWRRRYAHDLWNRLLHAMQHVIYDADAENAENVTMFDFLKKLKRGHLQYTISDPPVSNCFWAFQLIQIFKFSLKGVMLSSTSIKMG
jgi:hypothetical protein